MRQTKRDKLYSWEAALLAAVVVYWWGVVYPPLCPPERTTAQETVAVTEEGEYTADDSRDYVLRFKVLEWWGQLTDGRV